MHVLLWLALAAEVEIRSTLDGARQPAVVDLPAAAGPVPLLVHLHSWSSRYNTSNNFDEIRAEAARRGWAFVSPDFRGVNDHPEACGSELAVQDVLDAVEWMKGQTKIDERRIYLAGSSGGGYMALMMAGRAPGVWAAVSAWVPISDLAAWHAFSSGRKSRYAQMMEGCFGNVPTHGNAAQQYRRRSPVHFLHLARGLPLDIQTGIRDGHDGAVPVSHSLLAFNAVAAAVDRVPAADIETMTRTAAVPARWARKIDEPRAKPVLFRRASGAARVTIFEGGHEADFATAVRWLETHRQPETAIVTALQDDQLLPRDATGFALVPAPVTRGAGSFMVRVNGGAWQAAMPKLATGGPYAIEFRLGATTVRRTGILVGDIYLLAGQSNMVGRAPMVDPAPPDARVRVLTPEDTWAVAKDPIHEAIPRDGRVIGIGLALPFAKEMVRRTNVPVALVPCAIGGTSLEQWSPARRGDLRRSLYGNLLARAQAAGPAKAVLWYQGEADASQMATANSYAERFQAFVRQLRADLKQPELPFYYAQLGRNVVAPAQAPGWDTVREAQRVSESALAPGGLVATVDLPLTIRFIWIAWRWND
jgi:poly(3-hydroxybutyrate) depolymerase